MALSHRKQSAFIMSYQRRASSSSSSSQSLSLHPLPSPPFPPLLPPVSPQQQPRGRVGAGGQGLTEVLVKNRLTVGFGAAGRGGERHIIPDLPHLPSSFSFSLEAFVKRGFFFIAVIIINKPPPTDFLLTNPGLRFRRWRQCIKRTTG